MLADNGIMPVKQTVFTHMGVDVIFVQKPRTKEPVEKGGGRQTVTTEARCMYIYDGGEFMHNLITFQAGRLKEFLPLWRYITSDPTILQHVLGVKISLIEGIVLSQGTSGQVHLMPNNTILWKRKFKPSFRKRLKVMDLLT